MRPVVLAPNLPETFYAGSGRLAQFRDAELPDRPEDWLASTTSRYRQAPAGLTILPDGTSLLAAVTAEPVRWLGRDVPDPGILVKLLDAGQRLPLHVHPDRRFARAHLGSRYGKTEAWIILDAKPAAHVHIGFRDEVSAEQLARWVNEQDVPAMLAATNRIPVRAGDTVLCPAGTPHAIGDGILLLELQEPTDFSILLETAGFPVAAEDALLGLPLETALSCVTRAPTDGETLAGWRTPAPGSLLSSDAAPYFDARTVESGDVLRGFAVLVVIAGTGSLHGDWAAVPLERGTVVALPHAAGPVDLVGTARAVLCVGRPAAQV
jgi:mannose-6-phosphate isomerase